MSRATPAITTEILLKSDRFRADAQRAKDELRKLKSDVERREGELQLRVTLAEGPVRQQLDKLVKDLQARVNQTPITIPVQTGSPSGGGDLADLAGGGGGGLEGTAGKALADKKGFLKNIGKVTVAYAVARIVTEIAEGAKTAIDLNRANQAGDLDAALAAEEKWNRQLRSFPVAGRLGGAVHDLLVEPDQAKLDQTNRDIAAQEKIINLMERRNAVAKQVVDHTRAMAQNAEVEVAAHTSPQAAAAVKAQQELAEFNRTLSVDPRIRALQEKGEGAILRERVRRASREEGGAALDTALGEKISGEDLRSSGRSALLKGAGAERAAGRETFMRGLNKEVEESQRKLAVAVQNDAPQARINQLTRELQLIQQSAAARAAGFDMEQRRILDLQSLESRFNASQSRLRAGRQGELADVFGTAHGFNVRIEKEEDPQRKAEIAAERDAALDEQIAEQRRRTAFAVADYQAQARESNLRAAKDDYEADRDAFEAAWDAKIRVIDNAEEKMAAMRARDAARGEREEKIGRDRESWNSRAQEATFRSRKMDDIADVVRIRQQIKDLEEQAGGDPDKLAAARKIGLAMIEGKQRDLKMTGMMGFGDAESRMRGIQMAIMNDPTETAARSRNLALGALAETRRDMGGGNDLRDAAKNMNEAANKIKNAPSIGVVRMGGNP